jgi:excisionase family DNA binding protein
MTGFPNIEPLLDAKDVKRLLHCSLPLVYKWASSGKLPAVRIPCPGEGTKRQRDLVRFKKADVLRFIEEHYR